MEAEALRLQLQWGIEEQAAKDKEIKRLQGRGAGEADGLRKELEAVRAELQQAQAAGSGGGSLSAIAASKAAEEEARKLGKKLKHAEKRAEEARAAREKEVAEL